MRARMFRPARLVWALAVAGTLPAALPCAAQSLTPPPVLAASTVERHGQQPEEVQVQLAWLADPLTFPYPLVARITPDGIHIQGSVPTELIKQRVLQITQTTCPRPILDGVRVHSGQLLAFVTPRPEAELQAAAEQLLRTKAGTAGSAVQVQVQENGTLVVVGHVASVAQQGAIGQVFRGLEGCRSVVCRLDVHAGTRETPVAFTRGLIRPTAVVPPSPEVAATPLRRPALEQVVPPPPVPPVPRTAATPTPVKAVETVSARPSNLPLPVPSSTLPTRSSREPTKTCQGACSKPTQLPAPEAVVPPVPRVTEAPAPRKKPAEVAADPISLPPPPVPAPTLILPPPKPAVTPPAKVKLPVVQNGMHSTPTVVVITPAVEPRPATRTTTLPISSEVESAKPSSKPAEGVSSKLPPPPPMPAPPPSPTAPSSVELPSLKAAEPAESRSMPQSSTKPIPTPPVLDLGAGMTAELHPAGRERKPSSVVLATYSKPAGKGENVSPAAATAAPETTTGVVTWNSPKLKPMQDAIIAACGEVAEDVTVDVKGRRELLVSVKVKRAAEWPALKKRIVALPQLAFYAVSFSEK